jgi:hypothetical protein
MKGNRFSLREIFSSKEAINVFSGAFAQLCYLLRQKSNYQDMDMDYPPQQQKNSKLKMN